MEFIDKQEIDMSKRMAIKEHMVLSSAVQLITNEFPEKFLSSEHISGSINENIITITGNLAIWDAEIHSKEIEYNKEKECYKIILKSKINRAPTSLKG